MVMATKKVRAERPARKSVPEMLRERADKLEVELAKRAEKKAERDAARAAKAVKPAKRVRNQ